MKPTVPLLVVLVLGIAAAIFVGLDRETASSVGKPASPTRAAGEGADDPEPASLATPVEEAAAEQAPVETEEPERVLQEPPPPPPPVGLEDGDPPPPLERP